MVESNRANRTSRVSGTGSAGGGGGRGGGGAGGGGGRGSGNGGDDILMSSNEAISSRRRRHKTVHFGEQVCDKSDGEGGKKATGGVVDGIEDDCGAGPESRGNGSVQSLPDQFERNVEQLFSFIGSVLSAWDAGESSDSAKSDSALLQSRAYHESNHRKKHSAERRSTSVINYLLKEDIETNGIPVGSPVFKHNHWKTTPGTCNASFLRKVTENPKTIVLILSHLMNWSGESFCCEQMTW